MKIDHLKYVYFLGIGGIGMSALARWFMHNGIDVSGYDRTNTPLTRQLESEGVAITYQDKVEYIKEEIKKHIEDTLVIYTPAIPKNHQQWLWFQRQQYTIMKRSEVLGLITEGMFTVAVAGTHGKTTTTSMVSHILHESNIDCAAFMGGISTNYNTNLLVNKGNRENAVAVVEADEYDRSFMTLHPNISIITSNDADHLDIYGEHNAMKQTFRDFAAKLPHDGRLYAQVNITDEVTDAHFKGKKISYGIENGDNRAENLRVEGAAFIFDAKIGNKSLKNVILHVPGYHNVENAVAAMSVAESLGIKENQIINAVASYKGVKRRFEYLIKSPGLIFIDDYAHHPGEIDSLLKSVKALYPDRKVTVVFQPHLFSRTRDFADGFAQSLSKADEVLLLNIYPAREESISGVDSAMLLDRIVAKHKLLLADDALLDYLSSAHLEVLLTVGAGDIDRFVLPICELLKSRTHVA